MALAFNQKMKIKNAIQERLAAISVENGYSIDINTVIYGSTSEVTKAQSDTDYPLIFLSTTEDLELLTNQQYRSTLSVEMIIRYKIIAGEVVSDVASMLDQSIKKKIDSDYRFGQQCVEMTTITNVEDPIWNNEDKFYQFSMDMEVQFAYFADNP